MATKKAISQQSPMRVCMHVLTNGRTDVRVMREAETLVEAGFAVSIVDIEHDAARPQEEFIRGICLKHVSVSREFKITRFTRWTLFRAARIFIKSVRRLLNSRADIYHAHDEASLPAVAAAAWLRHKPLIFDSHELPLSVTSIRWHWLRQLFTSILKFVLPRCAGVISVSPPIAQVISERYHPKSVTLVRNILPYQQVERSDRFRQELGLDPQTRVALYQGAFQRDRGLEILVRAARFLESDIVIAMMGAHREGMYEKLVELIACEEVEDRIKLLPPVPYDELLTWTVSADVGLIIFDPAYSLKTKMCLPNKLFEYLMVGLPILASELIAITPILHTYGVGQIVSSLEPYQVGIAINAILAKQSSLDIMRHNALKAAKELCWDREKQKLVSMYKGIQNSH